MMWFAVIGIRIMQTFSLSPRDVSILMAATVVGAVCGSMYLSEVTVASRRGWVGSSVEMCVTLGQFALVALGWLVIGRWSYDWRIIFFVGAALTASLTPLGFWMLESPRYLQKIGKVEEAGHILADFLGTGIKSEEVQRALDQWRKDALRKSKDEQQSASSQYMEVLKIRQGWAAVLVTVMAAACGNSFVAQYAGIILEGTMDVSSVLVCISWMVIGKAAGCMIGICVTEHFGRVPLLKTACWGMCAISVLLAAASAYFGKHGLYAGTPPYGNGYYGVVLTALLVAFSCLYSLGLGSVVPAYAPEILPTRLRGRGLALARMGQKVALFAWLVLGIWLLEHSRLAGFLTMAAMNLVGAVAVAFICSETSQRSLEDIEGSLD